MGAEDARAPGKARKAMRLQAIDFIIRPSPLRPNRHQHPPPWGQALRSWGQTLFRWGQAPRSWGLSPQEWGLSLFGGMGDKTP